MFIAYKSKRPALTEGWISFPLRTQSLWPKVDSSRLFILDAVQEAGAAMFGDEWTGEEINALKWPVEPVVVYKQNLDAKLIAARHERHYNIPMSIASSGGSRPKQETAEEFEARKSATINSILEQQKIIPPFVATEQSDWERNKADFLRLSSVAQWLGQRCRDGDINTFYQFCGGQRLFELERSQWNCTDEFLGWLSNGGKKLWHQPGAMAGSWQDTYFFVCRSSFTNAKSKLNHAPVLIKQEDISKLSPDLRLAVQLAVKHELFDEGNGGLRQGQIVTKILDEANKSGREISKTKAEQMAAVMYWTDKAKQKASRSRKVQNF